MVILVTTQFYFVFVEVHACFFLMNSNCLNIFSISINFIDDFLSVDHIEIRVIIFDKYCFEEIFVCGGIGD